MARLESDDRTVPSSLELTLGPTLEEGGLWRPYRLALTSGRREIVLEDAAIAGEPVGRCLLGLAPRDEVKLLLAGLRHLLEGRRETFKFEPQEPNWSLEVKLAWSHRRQPQEAGWAAEVEAAPEGFTVVCWIDAANQIADHHAWDAIGIRFFTDTVRIRAFVEALEAEGTVK